ncbi:ribose-5-phosphate isomerase RpiA [Neisseria sp. Ec49-e6-T10]|uniref:ribose-5-phosphate isomerase RpiA n=1 Tax=Neisseria sp. Ec49-e6-T10 TaxID=3140744 RepID=UPI003EBFC0E6
MSKNAHLDKALQDSLKRLAAQKAIEFLPEGEVIGVGTGSTVAFFIEALAQVKEKIKGAIPTSKATTELLKKHDIPVFSLSEVDHFSAYFDGADEVNHSLQMIKGGGGALLQEKLVGSAATTFICMIDESKYTSRLGHFPLPVEVLPVARSYVARELIKLGAMPELRLNFTTDNGHQILDLHDFYIDEPLAMEDKINNIVGVMENGIFAKQRADILVLAKQSGVEVIR